MPLSISDSLGRVAGQVVVEVVEYLVLLVDGVEETAEELDPFPLILEEFDDVPPIGKVGTRNEAGEVGGRLEADVRLEVDEIREELVDLCDPVAPVECRDGEGSGGEGGDGGLSRGDDVEGGGHGNVVVVVAGKACNVNRQFAGSLSIPWSNASMVRLILLT